MRGAGEGREPGGEASTGTHRASSGPVAAQDPGYADGKAQGHWACLVSTAWAGRGECLAEECRWLALGWRRRALQGLLLSYRHNEHSGPG